MNTTINQTLTDIKNTEDFIDPKAVSSGHPTQTKFAPWVVGFGPGFYETKHLSRHLNRTIEIHANNSKDKNLLRIRVAPRRGRCLKEILFKKNALTMGDDERNGRTVPCTTTDSWKKSSRSPWYN